MAQLTLSIISAIVVSTQAVLNLQQLDQFMGRGSSSYQQGNHLLGVGNPMTGGASSFVDNGNQFLGMNSNIRSSNQFQGNSNPYMTPIRGGVNSNGNAFRGNSYMNPKTGGMYSNTKSGNQNLNWGRGMTPIMGGVNSNGNAIQGNSYMNPKTTGMYSNTNSDNQNLNWGRGMYSNTGMRNSNQLQGSGYPYRNMNGGGMNFNMRNANQFQNSGRSYMHQNTGGMNSNGLNSFGTRGIMGSYGPTSSRALGGSTGNENTRSSLSSAMAMLPILVGGERGRNMAQMQMMLNPTKPENMMTYMMLQNGKAGNTELMRTLAIMNSANGGQQGSGGMNPMLLLALAGGQEGKANLQMLLGRQNPAAGVEAGVPPLAGAPTTEIGAVMNILRMMSTPAR